MSVALIAGIVVVVLIVAIALSQRSRGPRVTQIETRREIDREENRDA
jgi:hypothetical protein